VPQRARNNAGAATKKKHTKPLIPQLTSKQPKLAQNRSPNSPAGGSKHRIKGKIYIQKT